MIDLNFLDTKTKCWSSLMEKLRSEDSAADSAAEKPQQREYLWLGSSLEDVLKIQGNPREISGNINNGFFELCFSEYFYPRIVFFRNKLSGWSQKRVGDFKLFHPLADINPDGFFTIGSSFEEVLAIHGVPLSFSSFRCEYPNNSIINFFNDEVCSWNNPNNFLRLKKWL